MLPITNTVVKIFFEERPFLSIKKMEKETNIPFQKIISGHVLIDNSNYLPIVNIMKIYGFINFKSMDTNEAIGKVFAFVGMKDNDVVKEVSRHQIETIIPILKDWFIGYNKQKHISIQDSNFKKIVKKSNSLKFNSFKEWIDNEIKESGTSIQQIGNKLKIDRTTFHRLRKNPHSFNVKTIVNLAIALNIEYHYLIDVIIDFDNNL